jgi:anti-sigma-K factor RskA
MNPVNEPLTDFERNARALLEESVARIDARTRSRLNQARHAALEAAVKPRRAWWRSYTLMPAGAVAAALLVAVVLWQRQPSGEPTMLEARAGAVEDLDLLTDSEGLELMDNWDGPFYEWAVTQSDANGESEG